MDVLDFLRAVSAGNLNYAKRVYEAREGKVPLNRNITYACGATWIIALPLVTAFQKGYCDIARFLIEKGADLDAFCRKTGKTPRDFMPKGFLAGESEPADMDKEFFRKIRCGDLEAVKSFLTEHPNTVLNENLVIGNKLYPLPLAIAFKWNRREIAEYLMSAGASPEAYCRKNDARVDTLKPKERR